MCCACSTPEAAKKRVGFPMSLQNQNAHKLTEKSARGTSNDKHESNRVRGTVITMSTVVTYLVSSRFNYRLIHVSRSKVVQVPIKGGVRVYVCVCVRVCGLSSSVCPSSSPQHRPPPQSSTSCSLSVELRRLSSSPPLLFDLSPLHPRALWRAGGTEKPGVTSCNVFVKHTPKSWCVAG